MNQGYEANHSGRFLEETFRRELKSRGYLFRDYGEDLDNLDMFTHKIVVSNVPYTSLYGCESRSEFVITHGQRKIRVECKWQESPGSVDEKFPYLLRNAVEQMPEQEVLILYGGNGARTEAIDWLKAQAGRIQAKNIYVVNINDFLSWVRRELALK